MSRWKTLVPVHSAAPCTIIAVTQWPTATSAVLFHSCTPALCLWVYVCHSVQVSDLKNTIHVLKLGQSSTYWKARSAWICSRNAFIALLQTTFSLVPHQCHLPFIVRISTVSASIAMCECVCVWWKQCKWLFTSALWCTVPKHHQAQQGSAAITSTAQCSIHTGGRGREG